MGVAEQNLYNSALTHDQHNRNTLIEKKTFKNLIHNRINDDLETWCVVSST